MASCFFQVHVKSEPFSDEAYDDGVVIDGSYPEAEVCISQRTDKHGDNYLSAFAKCCVPGWYLHEDS